MGRGKSKGIGGDRTPNRQADEKIAALATVRTGKLSKKQKQKQRKQQLLAGTELATHEDARPAAWDDAPSEGACDEEDPSQSLHRDAQEDGAEGGANNALLVEARADEVEVQIHPGTSVAVDGVALVTVAAGVALVHGFPLWSGCAPVLVASRAGVSSAVVVEAPENAHVHLPHAPETVAPALPPPPQLVQKCVLRMRCVRAAMLRESGGMDASTPTKSRINKSSKRRQSEDRSGVQPRNSLVVVPTHEATSLRPTTLPRDWRDAADSMAYAMEVANAQGASPPVIAVTGSKGVGKSTLTRLVVNSLLTTSPAVALLDADCGQPELGYPGMVNLSLVQSPMLGPPQVRELLRSATANAGTETSEQIQSLLPQKQQAYFIGDVNTSYDPSRYIKALQALYDHWKVYEMVVNGQPSGMSCREARVPLVVNTQGWVKGMGYDLLVEAMQHMAPTHMIQVMHPNPGRNLPDGVFWQPPPNAEGPPAVSTTIIRVSSPALSLGGDGGGANSALTETPPTTPKQGEISEKKQGPLPAVDARAMLWVGFAEMCVAHAVAKGSKYPTGSAALWDLMMVKGTGGGLAGGLSAERFNLVATALASAPPYTVPVDRLTVHVVHAEVERQQVLYVLNGSLVGLCEDTQSQPVMKHPESKTKSVKIDASQLLYSEDSSSNPPRPCLGMGLVRAVDAASGTLYILSSVPACETCRIKHLEVGRLELPVHLLQCGELSSPYISHHSITAEGTGAATIRPRNNIMRNYRSGIA